MKLFDGAIDEYRKRHDEIWPELVDLLKGSGVSEYSIFLDEKENTLLGILKYDNAEALDMLPQQNIMKKWWDHMHTLMETNPDHSPIETSLTEIFYLP